MQSEVSVRPSQWPHRVAVLLACTTFPLLWVGGLVTTTDSGMAVPDWPNTFGYNLFLYPITTWFSGPWDIFVEHGHRLLASVVGLITIGLVVVVWRDEARSWVRWLSVAALVLVILQGVLGGLRVVLNEQAVAMLHGCTGPLFFALTVALAVFTAKGWMRGAETVPVTHGGTIRRLAVVTCVFIYLQLMLGAVLRHVPIGTEPGTFAMAVKFHLFLAGVLLLHIVALAGMTLRHARRIGPVGWLAGALAFLVLGQITLGGATWAVKYAVPPAFHSWTPALLTEIVDKGWLQTHIVTAHMAVGSLMFGTSVALALYSLRLIPAPALSRAAQGRKMEVAL